jgi:dTMP kinase
MKGKFITIDGPNGVGKSTITGMVFRHLGKLGYPVSITKEPTSDFDRDNEEVGGLFLAKSITEDRKRHLQCEIIPRLKDGSNVICDRYIESSLVYSKIDGISFEQSWVENSTFRIPDISFLLVSSIEEIQRRLDDRAVLSRYEREASIEIEAALYKDAHLFLAAKKFNCIKIANVIDHPDVTMESMIRHILGSMLGRSIKSD